MKFLADSETLTLLSEAKASECLQEDPHCPKNFGEHCERGCFEITIDLQSLTVVGCGGKP
jgi:hypothetical protein